MDSVATTKCAVTNGSKSAGRNAQQEAMATFVDPAAAPPSKAAGEEPDAEGTTGCNGDV